MQALDVDELAQWVGIASVSRDATADTMRAAADWLAARTGRMLTRSNVPLGAVVALARVIEVVQESSDDMWFFGPYGWVLDDVVALTPVPCRGRPHLWTVPERVRQAIKLQWPLNMSDKD